VTAYSYRSRYTVEALQWTGRNQVEVNDFLGFEPIYTRGSDGQLWVAFDHQMCGPQVALPGDYVTRDRFAWPFAEFHAKFSPVNNDVPGDAPA
jgi:hypothetical protein